MDKPIPKETVNNLEEVTEALTGLSSILPSYMDDMLDYKEQDTIKTDWLNKKMK